MDRLTCPTYPSPFFLQMVIIGCGPGGVLKVLFSEEGSMTRFLLEQKAPANSLDLFPRLVRVDCTGHLPERVDFQQPKA